MRLKWTVWMFLLIYLFGKLVRQMIVVQMHSLRVSATYNKEFQVKRSTSLMRLGVSDWVGDYCLTPQWTILQLYHGENKLHSKKWWRCPLCSRPTRWIFIVLDHWNNIPRVDMSLPRTHYSVSEPTTFLFLLHNVFCTEEKNQIPIL